MKNKNIAYKAIFVPDGVLFLFENVSYFSPEDVTMRGNGEALFIELGNNIVNLTDRIIDKLLKNRTLFLYKAPRHSYDLNTPLIALKIEAALLDKLKATQENSRIDLVIHKIQKSK